MISGQRGRNLEGLCACFFLYLMFERVFFIFTFLSSPRFFLDIIGVASFDLPLRIDLGMPEGQVRIYPLATGGIWRNGEVNKSLLPVSGVFGFFRWLASK